MPTLLHATERMEPRLTIQIVGWNSAAALPTALHSLQQLPADAAHMCYLDNASADDSVMLVRRELPQAEVVELSANHGFAGAHNRGFARCSTPYVLVLNPDAALDWGGLQQLLPLFTDENIAAVQGKIYRDTARRVFDSAGIVMTLALNAVDRGAGEADRGQYDEPADIAAVTGAVGLYRLRALQQVAYQGAEVFDENFFAYKEDIDLGWRLRRAGWSVRYQPVLMAVHTRSFGPGTAAAWSGQPGKLVARLRDRRTHLSLRNWVWMLVKNMSLRDMLTHTVFVAVRVLVFVGLTVVYWPLMRVWVNMFRGLPRMIRKRTL